MERLDNFEGKESKSLSVEEVNKIFEEEGPLSATMLLGFSHYGFKEWTKGSMGSIYHFVENDSNIQDFFDQFSRSVLNIHDKRKLIEQATRYVADVITWVNKESSEEVPVEVSELVQKKRASCVGKSFLLAYLLSRHGLSVYKAEGYARNTSISSCLTLTERNRSYKKGSKFPQHLFNLPLEDNRPIEDDIAHIWVGTDVGGEIIYADPTTGLVSTRPEEREIFARNYKPFHGSLLAEGPSIEEKKDEPYHDLCFDKPAIRVPVFITTALSQQQERFIVTSHGDREIEDKFPILGFENVKPRSELS